MADAKLSVTILGNDQVSNVLNGINGKIQAMSGQLRTVGLAAAGAGTAILGAIGMSIKTFTDMGDEVQKLALKTGFSTESLSEWRHVLEISGASLSDLQMATKTMSSAIIDANDGLATYQRSFEHIGVDYKALRAMSPEEQFETIANAIADLSDQNLKASVAQDLFGRSGTNMLPMLALGRDGVKALREETHTLGEVFDQEAANKAAGFHDALTNLGGSVNGLKMAVAETLIPTLMPLIDKIKDIISGIREWMQAHPQLTKTITLVTVAIGALLVPLGLLMASMSVLSGLFMAWISPIGLVVVAIAALVAIGVALYTNWDTVCQYAKNVRDWFIELKDNIVDFVKNGIDWLKTHWEMLVTIIFPFAGLIIQIVKNFDELKEAVVNFVHNGLDWLKDKLEAVISPFKKLGELLGLIHGQGGHGFEELRDVILAFIASLPDKEVQESVKTLERLLGTLSSILEMTRDLVTNFAQLGNIFSDALDKATKSIITTFQGLSYMIFSLISSTQKLIDRLNAIPREIVITITTVERTVSGESSGGMVVAGKTSGESSFNAGMYSLAGAPIYGYAGGGIIDEAIAGIGLSSGRRYRFGESGREYVTPEGGGNIVCITKLDSHEIARLIFDHAGRVLKSQGVY
jgi:hypothetical protein